MLALVVTFTALPSCSTELLYQGNYSSVSYPIHKVSP